MQLRHRGRPDHPGSPKAPRHVRLGHRDQAAGHRRAQLQRSWSCSDLTPRFTAQQALAAGGPLAHDGPRLKRSVRPFGNSVLRILHISDPHGQSETMVRLHTLATRLRNVDVLAYTGDSHVPQLPSEWSFWPQRVKLAVPGEHDKADTFRNLTTWKTDVPWSVRVADALFVGIDSRRGWGQLSGALGSPTEPPVAAVVIIAQHLRFE